eukprot:9459150-Pyramimonas_sp.AAC.1
MFAFAPGADCSSIDFEEKTMFADLMVVEGPTGPDAWALWRKQATSLGLVCWKDTCDTRIRHMPGPPVGPFPAPPSSGDMLIEFLEIQARVLRDA